MIVSAADKLQASFLKSGMSPVVFFKYILDNREVLEFDNENFGFRVFLKDRNDTAWFSWSTASNSWIEA